MTEPIKEILPRDKRSGAEEVLQQFSEGIDEVVNFGTHILNWDVQEAKGGDENLPIAMMLRHILEMLDSVSLLVKNSSIDPAKIILRGILETFLGLEYLLESNTREKALGFLVWHYHQQLKLANKLTPTDPSYKLLEKKLQADKSTSTGFKPPVINGLSDFTDGMNKLLSMPLYASAEAEYGKYKNPKWFELYSGPKSIEQLAVRLKREGLYEVLYRGWSGPIHGTDIIQGKLSSSGSGQATIIQIRYVKDAQQVTMYAFNLALMTYHLMVMKRITNHKSDWSDWYLTIRDLFLRITGENLITVV